MKRTFLLLLAALATLSAGAQDKPFTEKVDVNLVLVDATVTDRAGNQILGLTKDDFVIKENGVVQEVSSLDYFTNRRLLDSPENKAAFKVERVKEERYFVIFFHELLGDDPRLDLSSEVRRARDAASQFIDKDMLPQDKVAIAGFDARLKIYADFTSDKKVLKNALKEVITYGKGLNSIPAYAGEASIMRRVDPKKMMNDTGRIYEALQYLAESMPEVAARKVLVLFSPGVGRPSSFSREIAANDDTWYLPMVRALNTKNVSVYSVNLLRNATGGYAEEQGLQRLAIETGGEYYKPAVNFSVPLNEIEKENNGYYLLSYYTPVKKGEGYQKIDVSLRNPEFKLKAREGYGY